MIRDGRRSESSSPTTTFDDRDRDADAVVPSTSGELTAAHAVFDAAARHADVGS